MKRGCDSLIPRTGYELITADHDSSVIVCLYAVSYMSGSLVSDFFLNSLIYSREM